MNDHKITGKLNNQWSGYVLSLSGVIYESTVLKFTRLLWLIAKSLTDDNVSILWNSHRKFIGIQKNSKNEDDSWHIYGTY